ncbi:MAG: cyclic nucleotide-binding domain-containing protein [Helicobacteraceae bacterium]|nr:cyclic nucleotide-binding domain-containing protein [Helicobacteraceae bacterium]
MARKKSQRVLNKSKLLATLPDTLRVVQDGATVIVVSDENPDNTLACMIEEKYYEELINQESIAIQRQKEMQREMNDIIIKYMPILISDQKLTIAQKALIQVKNKLPFFDDCSDRELVSIVDSVKITKLASNETLFLEGQTTKEIYYVISGTLSVSVNNVRVAAIKQKEVFGEMAFVNSEPRSATIRSNHAGATVLSFVIKEEIKNNLDYIYMRVYHNFSKILSKKLTKANKVKTK